MEGRRYKIVYRSFGSLVTQSAIEVLGASMLLNVELKKPVHAAMAKKPAAKSMKKKM